MKPKLFTREMTAWGIPAIYASFLYAVAALSGIDRNGSGKVPFVSIWILLVLLLASVGMFISLACMPRPRSSVNSLMRVMTSVPGFAGAPSFH